MIVKQLYTGCLFQGAYYIESNGEAAVIDPLREVTEYLSLAKSSNSKIKYIFETHFHADFISGHLTLSKKTNSPIIFGPKANPSFDCIIASDNQIFKIGDVSITVIHTPGHTLESTCYLLKDENDKPYCLFTGDTLFLGDVGRPDLAQKSLNISKEELAGTLYDSIQNRISVLSDDILIYPAHGAGSACGKNMMKETVDTLGNQKKMNYALRANMTREEFIQEVTDGLAPPPMYFPLNVKMNKEGYEDIEDVLARGTQLLSPDGFEVAANETGAIVLDVRHQDDFVKGHIPRSIFIGLDGTFAPWVGALIADVAQPILLVAPEGREEEAVTRLSRVGFDQTLGILKGGFDAWKNAGKEYDSISSVSAQTLAKEYENGSIPVFDVRKSTEYLSEHVEGANNTPLDFLNDHLAEFPQDKPFYIHCAGGYRSVIAASILKSRGIHNLIDVTGGFKAISETTLPKTDYVCPSTL